MKAIQFKPDRAEVGQRLDKVITDRLACYSRAKVQELIKQGYVSVNGTPGKMAYKLSGDETILVQLAEDITNPTYATSEQAETLPLDILYEDEFIVALNKPARMVVHPAKGHDSGTLVNALLARWPQVASVGGENRAGIVHRLDKDTSGVILIAKTEACRLQLMTQFESRQIQKRYLALVEGIPAKGSGRIDAPLAPDPADKKRMRITSRGWQAVTDYKVLRRYKTDDGQFALVEAFPKTGRTHQIRVHLASIGCAIVGDTLYGSPDRKLAITRHFLHADSISLTAPQSGQPLTIHAPLPPELQTILDKLA